MAQRINKNNPRQKTDSFFDATRRANRHIAEEGHDDWSYMQGYNDGYDDAQRNPYSPARGRSTFGCGTVLAIIFGVPAALILFLVIWGYLSTL